MPGSSIDLARAVDISRTGDLWLFRGPSVADTAIRVATNAAVNHVGMAVVLDDLPPLLWHAELGRSLVDMWSGQRRRGVQLHDLDDAVRTWATRYGQRALLRQLEQPVTPAMEDAVLRTVARMDGTPFPRTTAMARRWLGGRLGGRRSRGPGPQASLESAYCAEVVAITYTEMGLLPPRRPGWYDPGRFWSGDDLRLQGEYRLGREISVAVPHIA